MTLIPVPEGHSPDGIADGKAGRRKIRCQHIIVGVERRNVGAEGDPCRTRERRK
jgi:hypothetical protein